MWQRFSTSARRAVFHAQEEAQRFGEGVVGPEHLLLGILANPDSTGSRMLTALDIDFGLLRKDIETALPEASPRSDMTLTPQVKRSIDLAYEEAKALGDKHIGTEHLLLGIFFEGKNSGARALAKQGVHKINLRQEAKLRRMDRLPDEDFSADSPEVFDKTAMRMLMFAAESARKGGRTLLSPEDLFRGLLHDSDTPLAKVLLAAGFDLDRLRNAVSKVEPPEDEA